MTATLRGEKALGTPPVDAIRRHFPALERAHGAQPVAYFDGPGGTQVPRQVVSAMAEYLFHHNANTHWNYPSSAETDAAIDQARDTVAEFIGARPNEIAFGLNMTTLAYHASRALAPRLKPGDTVVVTELDHHANIAPWTRLESERGVTLRWVRMRREDGTLDWSDLEEAVASGAKLVAIGAASNALGTITDVRAVCAMARAVGALSFVDAVHLAPHVSIDVAAIDCDFLACSAYKFYGPHNGFLYARSALGAELDVPKLRPAPELMPERLETGTQNHEGIVGTAAAIDFLASLGAGVARRERLLAAYRELAARSEALFNELWEGLGAVPRVRRYGLPPGASRTPTLSFVVDGVSSDDVARALATQGVFVSNGDFYAATVVERLGHERDGLVRAGVSIYTTSDEIQRLVRAVHDLVRR
ncbi:MAG: cysteine desulfurase-like protein [Gemmatimonadaceae bacterium]